MRALEHAAKARETIRASMHARSSRSHRKLIQPSDAAPRMMSADRGDKREQAEFRVRQSNVVKERPLTAMHPSFYELARTFLTSMVAEIMASWDKLL